MEHKGKKKNSTLTIKMIGKGKRDSEGYRQ